LVPGKLREDARLNSTYEHIVLGVGGIGSAEDHSRIIRHSYHTADYASLTRDAFAHVRALEEETGLDLLRITGGLNLAPNDTAGTAEIGGYARSLTEQGHAYELMDGTELAARWPQWRVGAETVALYQAESGLLDIRRANSAHISRARARGVTFLDQTPARKIVAADGHVEVHTDDEVFKAATLTICAGSWTDTLTAGLGLDIPLTLTQEQVSYFAAPDLRPFTPERFPVWIFHGAIFNYEETSYYGFPVYGEAGVKLGRDMSGRYVTQETRSFEPNAEQTAENAEFLDRYLPGALGPELVSKTCVYDLTPDRNFVVDTVPGYPHIGLCIGAGHAAKFAALLGHIMADLAVDGETSYPIESFTLERPAIRDPGFPTDFRMARAAQEQGAGTWAAGPPAGSAAGAPDDNPATPAPRP
jgi:glycine/D-amino acid oxidase-like deaminating enzyme